MCLAQGHNTVTPVRLEPAAPRSQVKLSITVVKPVLSGHIKIDKTKVSMENEGQKYCSKLPMAHSAILLTCIKQNRS